jgi:hypothetical protein
MNVLVFANFHIVMTKKTQCGLDEGSVLGKQNAKVVILRQ